MCISSDRQKENVDYLLRLRSIRYRQTPMQHIRVKAHALRREHQLLLLLLCEILPISIEQEYKADASSYVCLNYVYLFIGVKVFIRY